MVVTALLMTDQLHALEFECSTGVDNRFIRMELPGMTHLCEVTVTNINNERRVMWYANHDTSFCSDKTTELKAKYENEWGFQCQQWPDHDGVDQLNSRQRTILDAELKFLIEQGQNQPAPFLVEGLKAAVSPSLEDSDSTQETSMLAVQFFLHEPASGKTNDVTHIISDDGISWNTTTKIQSLATHINAENGYTVNSALVSGVSDNGAMEIITVLESEQSASGCYGNQTLAANSTGQLVARTPHKFICSEAAN